MAELPPSRQEKSLGLLTSKFVSLLQEAEDGVLDIKSVSVRRGEAGGGRVWEHWLARNVPGWALLDPAGPHVGEGHHDYDTTLRLTQDWWKEVLTMSDIRVNT